jgi:basic amino acid/polyamine antiporter, APA family
VVACGAALAGVAALGSVRLATTAGGFLYVLHFVPPLLALVLLRRRDGGRPAFATPLPRLVIPLALLASAGLAVASGRTGFAVGGAWLVVGAAVHLARHRRRVSRPPAR